MGSLNRLVYPGQGGVRHVFPPTDFRSIKGECKCSKKTYSPWHPQDRARDIRLKGILAIAISACQGGAGSGTVQ